MKLFSVEIGGKSLKEELENLQSHVKAKPNDVELRMYLFQLLAILGQWDRAATQIKLCGKFDQRAVELSLFYDNILCGEVERQAVLNGQQTANLLTLQQQDPPPLTWVSMLAAALQDKPGNAIELREKALEAAAPCAGSITFGSSKHKNSDDTEESFLWIMDGDSRLGPICEVIANGKYFWIPFNYIQQIRILAPQGLCDLVWVNASVTLIDGREQVCLIPARYPVPDDYASQNDAFLLSRCTSWEEQGNTPHYIGIGQKTLFSDSNEYPILNIRTIVFDHEAASDALEVESETG